MQQALGVHVVVIIHVAEPPAGRAVVYTGLVAERAPTIHPGFPGGAGNTTAYLRPDSMNLSYSTDILQQSA